MTNNQTQQYIQANHNAPADRLIRAIFEHCTNVEEVMGDQIEQLNTAEDALDFWYAVDAMMLQFELPNGNSSFVHFIHQYSFARPHIEDIVNYGTSMENVPELDELLGEENHEMIYRT